jgi:murein L,D-transpeptidase YafK
LIDEHSRRTVLSALFLALAGSIAAPASHAEALKADKVVVLKSRRVLMLMRDGKAFATFPIALGSHPIGPKESAGDGRTPEGFYRIDGRNRRSPYHLSLHLSYPNEIDRISSSDEGVVAGGDIAIHGMPARFGHTDPIGYFKDWTDGCISVGNIAIEKIWAAVDDGTPVVIRP